MPTSMLTFIRTAHTVVWAAFVGCIAGIYVCAHSGEFGTALLLTGIITGEVGILAFNGWRCPLTNVAARYTEDRAPNFDIYLPRWLAEHNKGVFGSLFAGGIGYAIIRWFG